MVAPPVTRDPCTYYVLLKALTLVTHNKKQHLLVLGLLVLLLVTGHR